MVHAGSEEASANLPPQDTNAESLFFLSRFPRFLFCYSFKLNPVKISVFAAGPVQRVSYG